MEGKRQDFQVNGLHDHGLRLVLHAVSAFDCVRLKVASLAAGVADLASFLVLSTALVVASISFDI